MRPLDSRLRRRREQLMRTCDWSLQDRIKRDGCALKALARELGIAERIIWPGMLRGD